MASSQARRREGNLHRKRCGLHDGRSVHIRPLAAREGVGGGRHTLQNKAPFEKPASMGGGGIPTKFFDGMSAKAATTSNAGASSVIGITKRNPSERRFKTSVRTSAGDDPVARRVGRLRHRDLTGGVQVGHVHWGSDPGRRWSVWDTGDNAAAFDTRLASTIATTVSFAANPDTGVITADDGARHSGDEGRQRREPWRRSRPPSRTFELRPQQPRAALLIQVSGFVGFRGSGDNRSRSGPDRHGRNLRSEFRVVFDAANPSASSGAPRGSVRGEMNVVGARSAARVLSA